MGVWSSRGVIGRYGIFRLVVNDIGLVVEVCGEDRGL